MATTPNEALRTPPETSGPAELYRGEQVGLYASNSKQINQYRAEAIEAALTASPIETARVDEQRMRLDSFGAGVVNTVAADVPAKAEAAIRAWNPEVLKAYTDRILWLRSAARNEVGQGDLDLAA